ncbi:MAG: ribonuclease H-like domain-containing protein [Candidatus Zixiibacteriota bacterium]
MADRELGSRLDALKRHLVTSPIPARKPSVSSRYEKLAESLGAELVSTGAGTFCSVKTTYPDHYCHGRVTLGDLAGAPLMAMSSFSADETEGMVDSGTMLFVDTETTGLGGTGAVPFLVGFGSSTPEGFEIRQYLIPDYPDEAGMLEVLMNEFAPDKTLVSYNGAAFDLPLLNDRVVINRVARTVPQLRHLDLLHGTRRLFKRRLRDCSLVNIEREIFDFYRPDDIPGYLIPSVYFSWLAEESLALLPKVLEHNRLDIVSLYFLAHLLDDVFQSEGERLVEVDDMHSLARVYGRRRRLDKVIEIGMKLEVSSNDGLPTDIQLYHSHAFKRSGCWPEAVDIWERLAVREGREAYWANLELAKYFEHVRPDLTQALHYARAAQRACPYGKHHLDQLDRRVNRLMARLGQ